MASDIMRPWSLSLIGFSCDQFYFFLKYDILIMCNLCLSFPLGFILNSFNFCLHFLFSCISRNAYLNVYQIIYLAYLLYVQPQFTWQWLYVQIFRISWLEVWRVIFVAFWTNSEYCAILHSALSSSHLFCFGLVLFFGFLIQTLLYFE